MKPLLAIEPLPGSPYSATELAQMAEDNFSLVAFGTARVLANEEELRRYQAGELVLYRKPTTRRTGDKIVYERNGQRVVLQQERMEL